MFYKTFFILALSGTNTPRQLVDASGEVTFAARYTPWGDTLESSGTGNISIGYLGGLMDNATDLIYVGNGIYYDPTTGRFLNRNANPNSTNPYVPWGGEPSAAFLAPLALLSLFYSRRKKRGALDTIIILLVLGVSLGLGLTACNGTTTQSTPIGAVTVTPTPTPNGAQGTTVTATLTPNPGAPVEIPVVRCIITIIISGNLQVYDLTGYLALAMTAHGNDSRVQAIANLVEPPSWFPSGSPSFDLMYLTRFVAGYWGFYNLEGGNKVWDIKVQIEKQLKTKGIVLCGTANCDWLDYSTAGNIHFGFVAYRARIDHGIAAVAGGGAEQWDRITKDHQLPDLHYCLENDSILHCDNPQDQAAVDFGYYLAGKYSSISDQTLRTELTRSQMAKFQRPPSGFLPPHLAYPEMNIYDADHFNN